MKLVSLRRGDLDAVGCLLGDEVLDFELAAGALGGDLTAPTSVAQILEEGSGAEATATKLIEAVLEADDATLARLRKIHALRAGDEVQLRAPLPSPRTLFLHGRAYHSHVRDFDPGAPPERPTFPPAGFLKSPTAIVGPGEPIQIPTAAPDHVDFEGELAIVFGRECHGVSRDEAMDYVAGYTILNDVSARDWGLFVLNNPEAKSDSTYAALNVMYKNFETFCPQGPNVTTKDEISDHRELRLVTRLNGEVMQVASLSELIWDVPELIEQYSAITRFAPGDIMSTGTPGGVGAGRRPPVFMKDGDIISVEVTGVGTLSNPVAGPKLS